jgi:hypothetical protein
LDRHRIAPDEDALEAKQYIDDTFSLVIDTATRGGVVHTSQSFSRFPKNSALVVCLIACPEAYALKVQEAVDQAVEGALDAFAVFEPTVH